MTQTELFSIPPSYSFVLKCDGSSGAQKLEMDMAASLVKAFEIFKARQRKYGSTNIAKRGPYGVLVRLDDKLARLDQLFNQGLGGSSTDESVEDTCIDIANYALIALIAHRGDWPGWPHD